MLTGKHCNIILPDNLIFLKGRQWWLEVKTKSRPTKHKMPPRRFEHGLPKRQRDDYWALQEITNIPVLLTILELESKSILIGTLTSLERGKRVGYMEGELHIYFNRADFKCYPINISLPDPIQPLAPRTIEQGKAPIIKPSEFNLCDTSEPTGKRKPYFQETMFTD